MKYLIFLLCVFLSLDLFAQSPEDALRLSWTAPSGTARQQAIGGAMGSLGGEISALFVNPAGLGLYKTNEFVVSPGFRFQKDNSNYLGNDTKGNTKGNFNLGASGFVIAMPGRQPDISSSISIGVDQSASFGGNTFYTGKNDLSSFSEQYAEEFAASGQSITDAINNTGLSYGTRMALYTYLVDTATIGGVLQVIGQPQKVLASHGILNQVNDITTRGGATEIAIGIAQNNHDKWYIGLALGIPIVSYTRNLTFTETDGTGNTNNDFESAVYHETYTSKGVGVNFKLGIIFKPVDAWRFGLAIHSPTFYSMTDKLSASLTANTEGYAHTVSVTSNDLDQASGNSSEVQYQLQSPWKLILSGSYIFGGGREDVTKQKGFITADAEYVTNRSSRFTSPKDDNGVSVYDDGYFDAVNNTIKSYYKSSFNFRLGGELKFNTIAARAGMAYSTGPYKESDLKANRLFLTCGAGYRNKGIFIDLAYVQTFTKDVNFPYRLSDKANVYAGVKQSTGTIVATVGFKL